MGEKRGKKRKAIFRVSNPTALQRERSEHPFFPIKKHLHLIIIIIIFGAEAILPRK
jgi:hypothetical protein